MSLGRLVLGAVVLVLLSACSNGDDPSDEATTSSSSPATTSTEATTGPTTESVAEPRRPRALVVPTTVAPLLSTSTTAADPDSVALDELQVGDCIDLEAADAEPIEVGRARRIDCAEPHALEVFHVGSLNDDPDAPFPGDEAVLDGADQMCLAAFEPYVGAAYVDSTLEIAHLRPSEAVWLSGDRSVRCAVQDRELEPLVGTVQGSGR